jgi:transcriptional regulator with XRE-family HTH domain
LAKKTDIPYATIAKIESDVIQNPSLHTITKIAEGLGITIDDLIKN